MSDSVAYRNCICLAHIVDKDGKKMSKSIGNIVDPYDVFDHVGADPLRWYLACRIAPEVQKRISVDFVRGVASGFINTWWNTYAFFVMYAKLDRIDVTQDVPLAERPEIDRWALALLHRTVADATDALEAYDVFTAGRAIESFVDQLSNWYVRRNRRRFWKAAAGRDKQAAYLTLYECLHTANRLMAPIMPFITEEVHRNLVRGVDDAAPLSVHMSEWPVPDPAARNDALIAEIDVVQRVVGLGRAARNSSGVRVRQPLSRLLVRTPDEASATFVVRHEAQILEELNVKGVEMLAPDAELVSYRIKPNLPRIGKRFGKRVPAIRDALAAADGGVDRGGGRGRARPSTWRRAARPSPSSRRTCSSSPQRRQGYACAEEGGYLVGLDTELTEALEREGLARELVRTVQEARKQAGLDVSDRITLRIDGTPEVAAALDAHRDYVMEETLATGWGGAPDWTPTYSVEHGVGNRTVGHRSCAHRRPASVGTVLRLDGLIVLLAGLVAFVLLHDWVRTRFGPTPEELAAGRSEGPVARYAEPSPVAHHAVHRYTRLPVEERRELEAYLSANLIPMSAWVDRLAERTFQVLCLGEDHEASTRDFLAREFFTGVSIDVLLLETTADELARMDEAVADGEARGCRCWKSISPRSCGQPAPGIPGRRVAGIEETERQRRVRQRQERPACVTSRSMRTNFWGRFRPGGRHVVLFGGLHCASHRNWLFDRVRRAAPPGLAEEMFSVRVYGQHQNQMVSDFVHFLDKVGFPHRDFVIVNARDLHPHLAEWFWLLESAMRRYHTVVVFRD